MANWNSNRSLCHFCYFSLFHGAVEHKDSSGVHQIIKAGDVGFMTAGAGVTHTERTPEYLKTPQGYLMHGYQIWVALPKEKEERFLM